MYCLTDIRHRADLIPVREEFFGKKLPASTLVLRNTNTVTLICAPSPWMGEGRGEGARRGAAPRVPLTPSLSHSGERGLKDCVEGIRHRNYGQKHLVGVSALAHPDWLIEVEAIAVV